MASIKNHENPGLVAVVDGVDTLMAKNTEYNQHKIW